MGAVRLTTQVHAPGPWRTRRGFSISSSRLTPWLAQVPIRSYCSYRSGCSQVRHLATGKGQRSCDTPGLWRAHDSEQPPGWYPDPEHSGTLRYWDGQAWTAHRAPGSPGQKPAGYAPQPVRRGPRAWVIVLAVLAPLLAIGGCLSVLALTAEETNSACGPGNSAARDLSSYRALDEREYALIVKNPDAHVGEKIVIYGVVTQSWISA